MQSLEEENDSFPLNYPGNYLRFQRNPFHIKTKCCFFLGLVKLLLEEALHLI